MKYLFPSIWFGIIIFASLIPTDKLTDYSLFMHADKVIHFCMYLGLTFLLVPALTIHKNFKRSYLISFIISLFTGFAMECFQFLIANGRSAEICDIVANIIGSLAGIACYQLIMRNKNWENKILKI